MSNLLHDVIRKGINAHFSHRQVARIRAEHDAFVRTATLGTTYYTLRPHSTYDEHTRRPVHLAYTFTKRGSGIHAGQLISSGFGAGDSWTTWYQHGPLTNQRMPTAADYRADDDMAFAGFSASAQQQIAAAATAELRRLYPASVQHLVAA